MADSKEQWVCGRWPRNRALEDVALVEPGTIEAVEIFDMTCVAFAELREHGTCLELCSALDALGRIEQLGEDAVVLGPMIGKSWKTGLLHEFFLAPEVHPGELDESVKDFADIFATSAVNEGEAEVVDRVHEDAVLIVHGANVDRGCVVPG